MLGVAHYIIALLVSIRVILRPRLEPTVRLSWILVIELVPLVGVIAYVLFGEIRVRSAEVSTRASVRTAQRSGSSAPCRACCRRCRHR